MKPTLVPEVGAVAPTETVNESGVVPVLGVTANQLLVEKGVIVTLAGALEVSRIVCDGVVTPDCVLNVSSAGLAIRVLCRTGCVKTTQRQQKKNSNRR